MISPFSVFIAQLKLFEDTICAESAGTCAISDDTKGTITADIDKISYALSKEYKHAGVQKYKVIRHIHSDSTEQRRRGGS